MCGIYACLAVRPTVESHSVTAALSALHHRGPDNARQWLAPDARVALGHTRLSIIDLAGGDQPLASEDGRVRLVVNGEFYDFERLRSQLGARGHIFATQSDSEILVHLYEDYGTAALNSLRGEFAFALWDAGTRTLFAARDRFGIKPLYYAVHEGTLHLASEAKALFAAGVPARWDAESFHHHATGPALNDRTLFAGVHQVPPGHFLLATEGSLRIVRYWDFDYPPAAELAARRRPDAEYIAGFRDVLDEAVRLRLRADVPVGCYLSGGLDSCAVLGLAARHARTPIQAFTLTFDDAAYDEGAIAEEMARLAGADYRSIPIHSADLADHFAAATWHAETFFYNGHGISKFLLSRAVRDAGYRVVFTGEGSDEVLGGYAHFRRDMLLHHSPGRDPAEVERELVALAERNPVSRGLLLPAGETVPLDAVRRTLGFVPTWFEVFGAVAFKRLALLHPDHRARFAGRDGARFFLNQFDLRDQLTGRDPLNQSLYLWSKSTLPTYILTLLGDRMEMAHSVEGRVPFLDHHVVEFLRDVPVDLKIHGETEKYLLREAIRPVVTDTIYHRQKHPFLAPPAAGTAGSRFHELLQDTLRGPALAAVPFYDPARVIALLDALPGMSPADRVAWDPMLMSILSACVLQERFRLA